MHADEDYASSEFHHFAEIEETLATFPFVFAARLPRITPSNRHAAATPPRHAPMVAMLLPIA
jgi:hypothetical protein